ncbi:TPA: hypothetical protein PXI76_002446 [Yersinia enterocolitica]|nr:hypothetical protein [Yersinia enterocolitica]
MAYLLKQIDFVAKDLEQLGTKEKFWFRASTDDSGKLWLFKYSKGSTGEHWSEKCAAEICHLLELPHADYELAISNKRLGVISPSMIPDGYRMVMGNEVLHNTTSDYPQPQPLPFGEKVVRVREHTLHRVLRCLDNERISPPECAYDLGVLNAGDVFCGYLMLDVLISNQDRHHENWAIMLNNETGEQFLCPTYDHAASLGREMLESECIERLTTKDQNRQVPCFVRKARSELFRSKFDKKRLFTIDAFLLAIEHRNNAKQHWLQKLAGISDEAIIYIFNEIPPQCISYYARQFAIAVVLENKRRLLKYVDA